MVLESKKNVFHQYLREIEKELDAQNATEHTQRPALKTLMQSLASGITATNEPSRIEAAFGTAPGHEYARRSCCGLIMRQADAVTSAACFLRGKPAEAKKVLFGLSYVLSVGEGKV